MFCVSCFLTFVIGNLVFAFSKGLLAVENRYVILNCSSNGSVLWQRKTIGGLDFKEIYIHEVLVKPFTDRFSVPSLYDLRIENSSMDDAGLYQCIGNNGFGGIVVEYNVTILGSSITCSQSTDRAVGLNSCGIPPSSVEHGCHVVCAGVSRPDFTWIDTSTGRSISFASLKSFTLPSGRERLSSEFTIVAEMEVPLYQCSVANLLFCSTTPVIVEYVIESDVRSFCNSSGMIYCIANSSLSTCAYTWSLDDKSVNYVQNQTAESLCSSADGRSSGNFTCTATCVLEGERKCTVKVKSVEMTLTQDGVYVSTANTSWPLVIFASVLPLILVLFFIMVIKRNWRIISRCKERGFKTPVKLEEVKPFNKLPKCFEGDELKAIKKPSLPLYIFECASKYGDRPAFIDPDDRSTILYKDLEGRIKRLARVLWLKHEVRSEAKVALVLPNCIEYPVLFHALLYLGAVCVPILYSSLQEELMTFLKDSEASLVVTDEACSGKCKYVNQFCSFKILLIKGGSNPPLLEEDAEGDPTLMECLPKTKAAVVYSSGTTGVPKGCVHTHETYLANLSQMCDPSATLLENGSEVTVAAVSMSHMFGQNIYLMAGIATGCTTVVLKRFSVGMYLHFMQSYKATCAHLCPSQLHQILDSPLLPSYNLSSLLKVEVKAAIFDQNIFQLFKKNFPQCSLLKGYGMTEAMCIAKERMTDEWMAHSVGRLLPGVQARVLDLEGGMEHGSGREGELAFHSPALFLEYLGASKQLDECGFFKTGDIGFFDRSDRLHVTGRKDDLIKCNEDYINPADIEDIIRVHPKVQDAAVVGVQVEGWGEAPKAFVVKKHDSLVEDEIRRLVNDNVASDKRLRGGVEFIDSIPRSETGKICRALLKKRS